MIRARHDVFSKILSSETETERILAKVFTCCLLFKKIIAFFLSTQLLLEGRGFIVHVYSIAACLKRKAGI